MVNTKDKDQSEETNYGYSTMSHLSHYIKLKMILLVHLQVCRLSPSFRKICVYKLLMSP